MTVLPPAQVRVREPAAERAREHRRAHQAVRHLGRVRERHREGIIVHRGVIVTEIVLGAVGVNV